MTYMSGDKIKVPIVLRAPVGATTRGAQHAQSIEGFFTHVPGLKVICPATPYDAKGLIKTAIRDDNPVSVLEHKLLYGSKGARLEKSSLHLAEEVPEEKYLIPFGKAVVRREGQDVTIVANLLMMYRALEAAEILEKDEISVEVIDPRTLVPFDYETVVNSVAKTGRLIIVEEDTRRNGWGAEVAAQITEETFYYLDAPVRKVATYDVPIPFAPLLESYVVPSVERIVQEVRSLVKA